MYFNNQWGTVCRNGWSNQDAKVICRQLGYPEGNHQSLVNGIEYGYYGEGTGEIWLDDVDCTGTENSITECSHNGWANHDCGHNEDPGVVCLTGIAIYINSNPNPQYGSKLGNLYYKHMYHNCCFSKCRKNIDNYL